MSQFTLLLCSFLAATFIQALHWKEIYALDGRKRKRYTSPRLFSVSALIIVTSAGLGMIIANALNATDVIKLGVAAIIGFAPFPAIKALVKPVIALGVKEVEADNDEPPTVREFLHPL